MTDLNDTSNTAKLIFNVANNAPKANPDSYIGLAKDIVYDLNILENDVDANNDTLLIKEVYNICDGANVFIRPQPGQG